MSSVILFSLCAAFAGWVGMAIDDPHSIIALSRGLRIASFGARGFVLGVCAWQATVVIAALFAPGASVGPVMLIFLGAGVTWTARQERTRGPDWHVTFLDRITALAGVGLVAAASEALVSNASTGDSFHYSSLAGLIGRGELDLAIWDTITRSFGISAVHGPSVLTGELYFDGFSMLIAVASSVMLFVGVASSVPSRLRLQHHWSLVAGTVAVALLWMPFIWRFNASYLNSHALVAAVVLLAVTWIRDRTPTAGEASPDRWAWRDLIALSLLLGSLAMSRAEGPYFVALITAVVVWVGFDFLVQRPLVARATTAAILFAVALLWQLILLAGPDVVWGDGFAGILSDTRTEERADFLLVTALPFVLYAVVGMLAAALPLLDPARRPRLHRLVPVGALTGVLLANIGSFVISRDRGWDSLTSTYENVLGGEGGWGVVGATVLCFATVLSLIAGWRAWNELTLLAYLPLLIVPLGVLRGGAYEGGEIAFRVGVTDSMNRILLHFYPLALLTGALFAFAAFSDRRAELNDAPEDVDALNPQTSR